MNRRGASPKAGNDEAAEKLEDAVKDTKRFVNKAINEIGQEAAACQAIFGSLSGWIAGFVAMRVGSVPGIGVGGGALMLHFAQQNGYINLDWDKITKKVDKISDEASGSKPGWTDKMERFVDRKLDKAEDLLKKKQLKAKKWYHSVTGDEHYRATETHIFLAAFVTGLAIGLMCGR